MTTVTNLSTLEEKSYQNLSPGEAVEAAFVSACPNQEVPPVTYGHRTVACGDWCATTPPVLVVVKYTDVSKPQFVGASRPVASKTAARKFASEAEAHRVMAIFEANFGKRPYKVVPAK